MYKKSSRSYNYFFPIEKELSKRQDIREELRIRKKDAIDKLKIGQIINGKVRQILDHGAEIEFDNISGFLPISEISYEWINDPSEVLKEKELLKLKVMSKASDKKGNISIKLSRKGILPINSDQIKKISNKHKETNGSNQNKQSQKPSTREIFNPPNLIYSKKALSQKKSEQTKENSSVEPKIKTSILSSPQHKYTSKELELLHKYEDFYYSLETGNRIPETNKQKHFVKVCRGLAKPQTIHEKAYIKYLKNQNLLQNQNNE